MINPNITSNAIVNKAKILVKKKNEKLLLFSVWMHIM